MYEHLRVATGWAVQDKKGEIREHTLLHALIDLFPPLRIKYKWKAQKLCYFFVQSRKELLEKIYVR